VHELSIAQSLIELIEAQIAADDSPGPVRVVSAQVRIGALSGVVASALQSVFGPAASGTIADGARLDLEAVPVTVWCPGCRVERELAAAVPMRCPVCRGRTPDVLRGRELELVSLEIVDDRVNVEPAVATAAYRAGAAAGPQEQ
jgi:hydrogenase nickel incorporation protein HypA/HybF